MSGLIHAGAWEGREYLSETRPLVLFEPQSAPFRQLKANLGTHKNVTLIKAALGAKEGHAMMHVSSPDHSSSILAPRKQREVFPHITFDGRREAVDVVTLDSQMKGREGFEEMVIDVQGYELEVLKGATKTLEGIREVRCEVNTDEVYEDCARLDEVDAFLNIRGFERVSTDMWGGICGDATYRR